MASSSPWAWRATCPAARRPRQIDASGLILAPGFVDLQINGAFGDDFTADPATIWRVAGGLPRYGVTAFLPTIITSPLEQVTAGQRIVTEGEPAGFRGARPLGLHVEGPFLNPQKKGAHNPKYLRLPSVEAVAGWSPATGIRLVTLAPELPWALEVIVALSHRGVLVSEGHSMATYDQAEAGFDAGARYGTHLFNAMPALGHRDPGLPGALLTDERATVGFIADGVHTHPSMIKLIWQALGGATAEPGDGCDGGARHATWGASAGGLRGHRGRHQCPPGRRHAGRQHSVAGSSAAQPDSAAGCTLAEALPTVTTTPAKAIGLDGQRGRIEPGYTADLVLLTRDLHVHTTIAEGEIAYSAE